LGVSDNSLDFPAKPCHASHSAKSEVVFPLYFRRFCDKKQFRRGFGTVYIVDTHVQTKGAA
jgi:hypothetical protein